MKQDFIDCIEAIPHIESLFHQDPPVEGLAVPNPPTIYSNEEFALWKSELAIELQDIVDRTSDKFINDTLNLVNGDWNGWNDEKMFRQLKGNLQSIRKRIDRYYPSEVAQSVSTWAVPSITTTGDQMKKYSVFVSSTYEDLKEERQAVIGALLEGGFIPIGMEQFPASPLSQWQYITQMIDQCDYYVLISAGKYGSIDEETGISYTEKEYRYALEKGVPVLAFLHKAPENIPVKFCESTEEGRKKLETFRSTVKAGRLVQFYETTEQLKHLVSEAAHSAVIYSPRPGWIRADSIPEQEQDGREVQPTVPFHEALIVGQNLSHEAMILVAYASKDPHGQIMYFRTLSGASISTAGWNFITDGADAKTEALWKSVIDELESGSFIKLVGKKDKIYEVTRSGYAVADAVIDQNDIDVSKDPREYLDE